MFKISISKQVVSAISNAVVLCDRVSTEAMAPVLEKHGAEVPAAVTVEEVSDKIVGFISRLPLVHKDQEGNLEFGMSPSFIEDLGGCAAELAEIQGQLAAQVTDVVLTVMSFEKKLDAAFNRGLNRFEAAYAAEKARHVIDASMTAPSTEVAVAKKKPRKSRKAS